MVKILKAKLVEEAPLAATIEKNEILDAKADTSLRGPRGEKGDTSTVSIGKVELVNNPEEISVENVGTKTDVVLDFKLLGKSSLLHSLTIGNQVFDGTSDIVIPIYSGE
jgi:archaellum component FlaG (FlaF/FlaG flagellin family)